MKNSRPTIGLFTNTVDDPNNIGLWQGMTDAAEELDFNLICIAGRQLKSPHGYEAQGNALFELINEHNVDGLVIWASVLSHFVPREVIEEFCRGFLPLPLVSLGRKMDGIPMVSVNDGEGYRHIFNHLIEDHGYRRVALITGAEDSSAAKTWLDIYTDMLDHYSLPFDPQLVAYGDFALLAGRQAGRDAMAQLLDRAQGDFDAVVVSTDNMALGALQVLQERGIHVPDDIAITGRDDIAESRVVTPSLTTSPINMYGRARKAMELIAAQLTHEEVPEEVVLPSELRLRQSCGCLSARTTEAAAEIAPEVTQAGQTSLTGEQFVAGRAQFLHYMRQALPPSAQAHAETILESFIAVLDGAEADVFLNTLNRHLYYSITGGEDARVWHDVLSTLRGRSLPYLNPGRELTKAETLWQQARVIISEATQRSQAHQHLQAEQQAQRLRRLGQTLNATFDVAEMMDILARELPALGISAGYLALYENPRQVTAQARLMLAFDQQGRGQNGRLDLPPDGLRFNATELLPPDLWPQDRRYRWVLEPLYFQKEQMGFVILEVSPAEDNLCEVLREQISSALQGGSLLQTVSERTHQLEVVASLSERLTAILDFDELLLTLVNQVKKSFDYYHAHVYVLDPESQNLVMTAGAGQAGAEMKARGHSIPLNAPTSLVARAARRREIVSVENARQAEDWLPNALLPDTYSEMAIPIILEDAVVGVLDVQQDEIAGLDEGDAGILRALANQVAVAIHNARLFAQTESALAEVQATQQKYLQQAWEEASRGQSRTYRYDRPGLPPISEAARRKARQLAQREQKPALSSLDENQPDKKSLLAPVVLGGATIGTFQLHESEAHVWTEDDLALIEAILDQVAQNAENLRLFDETQERADSERTLREIAEKMRSATSLDRLIKIVTEELGQHLSAEYARIDMGIEAQSTPAEMGVQNGQK